MDLKLLICFLILICYDSFFSRKLHNLIWTTNEFAMKNTGRDKLIFNSLTDARRRAEKLANECKQMLCQKIINEETHDRLKQSCRNVLDESIKVRDLVDKSPIDWVLQKAYELDLFVTNLEMETETLKPAVPNPPAIQKDNKEEENPSKTEDLNVSYFEKLIRRELKKQTKTLVKLRKAAHKLGHRNKLVKECSGHIWTIRQRMERIEDELGCENSDYICFQYNVLSDEMSRLRGRFKYIKY